MVKIDKTLNILMNWAKEHFDRKREDHRTFLMAARNAVTETRIYAYGKRNEKKKEEKLSRLWSKAAIAAQPIDPELASRLDIKSNYWADPNRWTDEAVNEAKIYLEDIEKEIRKLFSGKRKGRRNK